MKRKGSRGAWQRRSAGALDTGRCGKLVDYTGLKWFQVHRKWEMSE